MAAPREYDVVVERDGEALYVVSVASLPACHTQARSRDDLMRRIMETIELRLEIQREADSGREFMGVQRVRLAA